MVKIGSVHLNLLLPGPRPVKHKKAHPRGGKPYKYVTQAGRIRRASREQLAVYLTEYGQHDKTGKQRPSPARPSKSLL